MRQFVSSHDPVAFRVVCAGVGGSSAIALLQRANLVDPSPVWTTGLGAVVGFSIGAWLSVRVYRNAGENLSRRQMLGLFALPLLAIFFGTFSARFLFEAAAFGGIDGPSVNALGTVASKDTKWQNKATISLGPNGRHVQVRTAPELYSTLEPWRSPGRDCLKLTIETGRWGVRRVILPNYLDRAWGLEHYQPCPATRVDPLRTFAARKRTLKAD
jgi:hypothetical protein